MKKALISIAVAVFVPICARGDAASEDAKTSKPKNDSMNVWIPTMVTALNVSQIAFSNWTQGGSNALAWTATANIGYNYRSLTWGLQNHLRASYGRNKIGSQSSIVTDNSFLLDNVLTYSLGWATNPFFSNTIITTIAEGYSYASSVPIPIANFFDPGYVTQSLGFGYSKTDNFSTRLGLAVQEVFTNRYRQYTDNPGTTNKVEAFKFETGLESVTRGQLQIADNLLLTTGLRLFTRFKDLSVWDVRWENLVVAKVNSFINVNLVYDVVYQKDQSLTTQMKEGLQVGVTYTLF